MITTIGNPVFDYIETKKVKPEGRVMSGCSTNAALALAKLGADVRLVGAVGNDFRADFDRQLAALNIERVLLDSEETGGFSLIYYDDYGNRTLDLLGRATDIAPVDPKWYNDAEAVLIGPILGEVSLEAIADIRRDFSGLMFCDPQGLLRGADDKGRIYHERVDGIEPALGLFDIVKPNELEAQILTGIDCRKDPFAAAEMIKSWGPKVVVVTLAELGSLIFDGSEFIQVPPYHIDLVDATGAGDTYMAGFTFEYLKSGGDLRRSGCFASCTSSVMIEFSGPDFSMTESAVRERQETLLAMEAFQLEVEANQQKR
ncbi:ribokinase [candidate division GN15 bacterium]|nr:ribokinase [candidate division GN15 bacterium]